MQPIFNAMRAHGVNLQDFRFNGMLLPAVETQAQAANLPLHVVGHTAYNASVHEHLHTIRRICDSIRVTAVRHYAAIALGLFTLVYLRRAVVSVGYGSIDETPLFSLANGDVDPILMAAQSRLLSAADKKSAALKPHFHKQTELKQSAHSR